VNKIQRERLKGKGVTTTEKGEQNPLSPGEAENNRTGIALRKENCEFRPSLAGAEKGFRQNQGNGPYYRTGNVGDWSFLNRGDEDFSQPKTEGGKRGEGVISTPTG